jgi:hypothetical protein
MHIVRIISIFGLACSVLVTGAFGPLAMSAARGDVNGDRTVNVLDAQTMVAHMLGTAQPVPGSDVNRDGHVDILDLQIILAQLNGVTRPEPTNPADSKTPRAILVSVDRSWARVAGWAIEILSHEKAEPRLVPHSSVEPVEICSPVEERYLFTLTANAPPLVS